MDERATKNTINNYLMRDTDSFDEFDWDEEDPEDDMTSDYLPCPECGEDIYVDAVQCPKCGWYVTWDSPGGRSARWDRVVKIGFGMIAGGVLLYLMLWLLRIAR